MDAATAALVGAGIGAAVTLAGTFGVAILQGRRERAIRREYAAANLEKERRIEYIKMLTSARELRYIALRTFQHLATRPVNDVDSLLTELSRAYYMIALIAPEDTRLLAWDLRESIFKLWTMARDNPDTDQYQDYLAKVREFAGKFRVHVTAELNLTDISSEGNMKASQKPRSFPITEGVSDVKVAVEDRNSHASGLPSDA
jgi:hypothetical protein